MNFPLAREIYGMTPFCVDSQTLPAMLSVLDDVRNGVKYSNENELKNSVNNLLSFDSELRLISRPYDLDNNDSFDGVSLMNINGPILLNSGASTTGMKSFSDQMLSISNDSRIKGFILLMDSGGGSTAAVELMVDTINEIKSKGLPVYVLIDKGGTLGSAAYGIASAADAIYYQSDMSIVGSLGTMIKTEGRKANTEADGVKYLRVYATKSTQKNGEIEEALNNDNYDLIINDLLDPINEHFLTMLKGNRSQLTDDQLNGSVSFAVDSVGVYVDGKSSITEIAKEILNSKSIINFNQSSMTRSELQSQHPELFNEVFNAGVTAESERVQSWLAHSETDLVQVTQGIESGKEITPSQREKLLVKSNKMEKLNELKSENAAEFLTPESTMDAGGKGENAELENAFKFKLK